jgi:hypothetical protein
LSRGEAASPHEPGRSSGKPSASLAELKELRTPSRVFSSRCSCASGQ